MSTFKFEGKTQAERADDWEKADEHLDALYDIDELPKELKQVQEKIKEVEAELEEFDRKEEKKKALETKLDSAELKEDSLKAKDKEPKAKRSKAQKIKEGTDKENKDAADITEGFNELLALDEDAHEADKTDTSYKIEGLQSEIEELTKELDKRESVQSKLYRLRKRAKKIEADIAAAKEFADKNDAEQKEKDDAKVAKAEAEAEAKRKKEAAAAAKPEEAPKPASGTEAVIDDPNKNERAPAEVTPGEPARMSENREGYARDKAIKGDIYEIREVERADKEREKSVRDQIRKADTFPKLWAAIERTRGLMRDTPEEIKTEYIKFFTGQKEGTSQEAIHALPEEFGIRFQALNPFLQKEAETYDFGTKSEGGPTEGGPTPKSPDSPEGGEPSVSKEKLIATADGYFEDPEVLKAEFAKIASHIEALKNKGVPESERESLRKALEGNVRAQEHLRHIKQTTEKDTEAIKGVLAGVKAEAARLEEKRIRLLGGEGSATGENGAVSNKEIDPKKTDSKLIKSEERPSPEPPKRGVAWLLDWIQKRGEKKTGKQKAAPQAKRVARKNKRKKDPKERIEPEIGVPNAIYAQAEAEKVKAEELELEKLKPVMEAIDTDPKLKEAYDFLEKMAFPKEPRHAKADIRELQSIIDKYPTSGDLKKRVFKAQKESAIEPNLARSINTLQQMMYGIGTERWNFAEVEAEKVISNGRPVTPIETVGAAAPTQEVSREKAVEKILDTGERARQLQEKYDSSDTAVKKAIEAVFAAYNLANPKSNPNRIPGEIKRLFERNPAPTRESFVETVGINKSRGEKRRGLKAIETVLFGTESEIKNLTEAETY